MNEEVLKIKYEDGFNKVFKDIDYYTQQFKNIKEEIKEFNKLYTMPQEGKEVFTEYTKLKKKFDTLTEKYNQITIKIPNIYKQFITNDMYYNVLINNEDLSKEWTEKLRILMTKNAQCKINIQTVKTKLLTTALNITRKNKWLFIK